jgi:hypothetical protein
LRRLRDHFHEWPCYEGGEYEWVGFAYYEGCGDSACCGDLLAEAAPVALGAELVARHGFVWVSLGPGRLGVAHRALAEPVDLAAVAGGGWCDEPPETPARGHVTHGSLAGLVRAVGGRLPAE